MQIRRLTYFDYPKLKRLISYLSNEETDRLAKSLIKETLGILNSLMPLALKFKPESFILIENQEILGLVTISSPAGNPYKKIITRLIFKENMYEIGEQLISFVIQKYGAMGVKSFIVTVDECHDELMNLFIKRCGFRQCASEILWKIEHPTITTSTIKWRYAQNSDARNIMELFNSELENIYKPALLREEKEFKEVLFSGFNDYYKTRYIIDEENKILCYFSITTTDNLNYLIDLTTNSGYEIDFEQVINLALNELKHKRTTFYPIIKHKKYTKNSSKFEEFLQKKSYKPIQTQHILVKDYYSPILETDSNWKVFLLGENHISTSQYYKSKD